MSSHRDGFRPSTSGWSFHGRDRSPDLEIDPHREITTIDVERDLYVLRVEERTRRIAKTPDLTTGWDEARGRDDLRD
jgi:hypothetical protein